MFVLDIAVDIKWTFHMNHIQLIIKIQTWNCVSKYINISSLSSLCNRRQMKTSWSCETAARLKGMCPRQLNQCGLLLQQAFPPHLAPFSPSGFLPSSNCTHSPTCSFHLDSTPAYLTSEWASLNALLALSGPSLSLSDTH